MLPFSPLTNHHSDFKPFFCATAVFWEQLQRELDVVPDLVMSGALQHIDHLHVDWTRFCFESLSCIQNLFKKRILSNCFKSWSHLPPRDDWTNIPLVNDLSRAMETLSTLGKDRGLVRTTEVTYTFKKARQAKVSNILLSNQSRLLLRSSIWKMNLICITKALFRTALNKVTTKAHNLWNFGCRAITINGIW